MSHEMRDHEDADEARRRLRRSEEREELFRHAFACLPEAVVIVGDDDCALEVSEAARRLLAIERGSFVLGSLADGGVSNAELAAFLSALERAGRATAEIRLVDRHGEARDVVLEGTSALLDLYVLVLRDVTEQKRLEAELARSRRVDSIGHLTIGTIHDFNNLLTPIVSMSAALASELGPGAPGAEFAREIHAMAESAVRLAKQIIAFARTGASASDDLDVNEVLSGMRGLLQHVVGERVELVLSPDDRVGRVQADRSQLEHVIINFAANARDAMPGGGRLTIETAEVLLGADDAYVAMTLTDTGLGMDAETCARIFDPFFTTKAVGGTGLGLATAQRFATLAGGRIAVRSRPGEGTHITLYLPRRRAPAKAREERAGAVSSRPISDRSSDRSTETTAPPS